MDPNEALKQWREARDQGDRCLGRGDVDGAHEAYSEAHEHADDLVAWLDNGGFAPDWRK